MTSVFEVCCNGQTASWKSSHSGPPFVACLVIWLALVLKAVPSDQVPTNGGVPANVATIGEALFEHLPALTTTLMSMGVLPIGLMTTDSPVAVDGVPFAIVHFAVAGGARSTRAVKEDSMFVAAGAVMVASRIVQSTWYAAVARATLQSEAATVPRPAA